MSSRKRKPTFVLVIPRFEDIFHSYYSGEIIRGVSLSASRLNADYLIHIVDRSDHRGWLDSTLVDKNYIDGIIFADIDNDVGIVKKAIRLGMPCMVLNNILDEPINYVAVDNWKAAYNIAEHFCKLGHKEIATIAGDVSTQAGLKRLEGFREALDKNGITIPRSHITFGDFLRTPARTAARKLLNLKNRPTAIFAGSDVMALELWDEAKTMGIKIPQELSIVGFDDNPLIQSSSVKLSTVSQPLMEMGRLGTEKLYEISRGKVKLPYKQVLATKFIKRESTQKVNDHEENSKEK
ncbi:MAG: substrate-binding domain-containing protein [Candidatus Omnitrophica bacterium]|nr:substrate-binding domain-containing protein [Candidatus Omnitrophota bacterium]